MNLDERVYCKPVKSGFFEYDGHAFRSNGVVRCRNDRLYDLLTWKETGPVLTKAGKPRVHQPPPHKDETAEFYQAQCIHYGLKPYKTKPAAKKELLTALNANSQRLSVPQSILEIERDLQAQFKVSNATAKRQHEEQKKQRQEEGERQQLKRKRQEDELTQKVTNALAKCEKRSGQRSKRRPLDLKKITGRYRVVSDQFRQDWGSERDGLGFYTLNIGLAPPTPSRSSAGPNALCGMFDLGAFEGYMRLTSVDKDDRTLNFHWRGRDTGEGQMTFGSENVVRLTFLNDDSFVGEVAGDCFNVYEIKGVRETREKASNADLARNSHIWSVRYDQINEEGYEQERVGRWR